MLKQPVKTSDVLDKKRAGSVRALASLLEVSTQAVYEWKKSGSLPEVQGYRLQLRKPEWFRAK